jgi:hypothetical protein
VACEERAFLTSSWPKKMIAHFGNLTCIDVDEPEQN